MTIGGTQHCKGQRWAHFSVLTLFLAHKKNIVAMVDIWRYKTSSTKDRDTLILNMGEKSMFLKN